MSKLPSGWARVTLNDVATWASGGTPSRTNPNFFNGSIPWLKTGELGPKTIYATEEHISDTAVMESSAKVFPKGAVAMAMYGATIGKTSILGIKAATNQACAVGIPDATTSEFLYYFLTSQEKIFIDAGKGGAQPNISQSVVKSWPIFLPPFAEQTRIVTKLEELLTDLDAGVAELKTAQKKLAQYRQSLLKAAVEGALTAQWREDNPATESGAQLLERILQERRARWEAKQLAKFAEQGKTPPKEWQKKYPEPVQPDTTDLPPLPEGWVWASLDMLGEIASGVAKGSKRANNVAVREVPYMRVANVQRGYLDLSEVKTILATEQDITELALQDGDVLFNEGGDRDKLGRGWVWRDQISECIHQNHVFRMRPYIADMQSELISHHGNTFGKLWFQKAGKQTTNLASINMTMLRMFPVPVAPATEQQEIMEQIRVQIESLYSQENSIELALKQSSAQRQNILRAAFAGQLVTQNPNDEPASVLLERIRAQRAERAKQPKPRKTKKKESSTVARKLVDVLIEAGDWLPAQEAFRRCGIADGAQTEEIEALYAELRVLDKSQNLSVKAVFDLVDTPEGKKHRKVADHLKWVG
ncbi:restriction endonuclease subunit S [Dickeya zeae]|uniref:restriction endonuclease subunit S n=1 Tax=Dickeya zeae TaxID=204042 RepID=UPI001B30A489|nr:restriction endonuclease subunit S [Dickeya zeae]